MSERTAVHPAETELALFAGGDLGVWRRRRIASHTRQCASCRKTAEALSMAREHARDLAEDLPPDTKWNDLAAEMSANIRLGLEAGECIEHLPSRARRPILRWNLTTALAGVALLGLVSLWLRLPEPQMNHLRESLTTIIRGKSAAPVVDAAAPNLLSNVAVLEASPSGATVQENGSSLKLLAPPSSDAVSVSVNLQDSVSARYVDADSGQLTISKVYYAH
jgi:hypothetical protein